MLAFSGTFQAQAKPQVDKTVDKCLAGIDSCAKQGEHPAELTGYAIATAAPSACQCSFTLDAMRPCCAPLTMDALLAGALGAITASCVPTLWTTTAPWIST